MLILLVCAEQALHEIEKKFFLLTEYAYRALPSFSEYDISS